MKILQVIHRYPPSVGGSQNVCYRISKELVKKGHDVTIVTTKSLNNRDIRGIYAKGINWRSKKNNFPDFSIEEGIKVYRFQPLFQILTRLYNPKLFTFLYKNFDNYEIIHVHCYTTSEMDYCARIKRIKKSKTKLIITAHDIITPYGGILNYLKNIYDKTIGKFTLNSADILTALTEENVKQYIALGCDKEKIKIIPNGIDFQKINKREIIKKKNKLYGKNRVCLFVGRIVEYKGAQHIIESIPSIIKEFPEIKFVFIGEDQGYKDFLIKEAKELGVLDKCVFTGKVSEEELVEHYAMADVFVLPSIGEGFGLTAIEAMYYGTPAILADSGGLKWILKDVGGYPINMEDNPYKQITNLLIKILKNDKKVDLKNKIINNFNWNKIVSKLELVYGIK